MSTYIEDGLIIKVYTVLPRRASCFFLTADSSRRLFRFWVNQKISVYGVKSADTYYFFLFETVRIASEFLSLSIRRMKSFMIILCRFVKGCEEKAGNRRGEHCVKRKNLRHWLEICCCFLQAKPLPWGEPLSENYSLSAWHCCGSLPLWARNNLSATHKAVRLPQRGNVVNLRKIENLQNFLSVAEMPLLYRHSGGSETTDRIS